MFRIHPEGKKPLFVILLILAALAAAAMWLIEIEWLETLVLVLLVGVYFFFMSFFRNPLRHTPMEADAVIAPADGKVVTVQKVVEEEYFKDERIQVSIFMSPLNVHVNRYPVSGTVKYSRYHPGKYLVAWHPKSSVLNERTTVVVDTPLGIPVLYRQIAGAVARRIIMYAKAGIRVVQGKDSGFIRFGSRVDVFLPTGTDILVKEGDTTRGGEDVIARLKK